MTNQSTGVVQLFIVLGACALVSLIGYICYRVSVHREGKRQKRERRYLEARALARDLINTQLRYTSSVIEFDNATIEAFETIIAEIVKTRKS